MNETITDITIGNWYLVDGKPTRVTPENINHVLNTRCQPIPLTSEILLKIGFVEKEIYVDKQWYDYFYSQYDGKHNFYCKARFEYSRDTLCCEFNYYTYGIMSCFIQSLKLLYLHQFQDAMRICNVDFDLNL